MNQRISEAQKTSWKEARLFRAEEQRTLSAQDLFLSLRWRVGQGVGLERQEWTNL